jgi:hypothetical protein
MVTLPNYFVSGITTDSNVRCRWPRLDASLSEQNTSVSIVAISKDANASILEIADYGGAIGTPNSSTT